MTDRVLLEAAAKAAGYCFANNLEPSAQGKRKGPFVVRRGQWAAWNPLTDDGDAFRLAVSLGMFSYTGMTFQFMEAKDCESTRRAIVRAAASIRDVP